jgi:hypothetical protein
VSEDIFLCEIRGKHLKKEESDCESVDEAEEVCICIPLRRFWMFWVLTGGWMTPEAAGAGSGVWGLESGVVLGTSVLDPEVLELVVVEGVNSGRDGKCDEEEEMDGLPNWVSKAAEACCYASTAEWAIEL